METSTTNRASLTLRDTVDLFVVAEHSLFLLLRSENGEQIFLFLLLGRRVGRFALLLLIVEDVVQVLILVRRLIVGRTMAVHVGHLNAACCSTQLNAAHVTRFRFEFRCAKLTLSTKPFPPRETHLVSDALRTHRGCYTWELTAAVRGALKRALK